MGTSLPSELVSFLQVAVVSPVSDDGALSLSNVSSWEASAARNPKAQLARTILSHSDIRTALTSRAAKVADQHVFNHVVDFKTGPRPLWLFATTNVARYAIMKKLKLKDFQLSQSYLFFWDKLNKSNYYLELMIQHADLPVDDRLVNHLSGDLISDGGQWDMAVNLLENYGFVPQSVYPESTHSSLSAPLNALLKTKLREHALILRNLSSSLTEAGVSRDTALAAIYNIMTATLGVPPHPKKKFVWEYLDADGKAGRWEGSPLEYYAEFGTKPFNPSESFSLINDPRNDYSKLYTVDKLGNIWGGRPILYVNTEIENMKNTVIKVTFVPPITTFFHSHSPPLDGQSRPPVFFGCDVGIMDTALFEYETAFDISLGLTKADRLRINESAMTHAMVISGVHLDASGKPIRYKVENSWGETAGQEGYFVMTDRWFEEFVYQIVVPKSMAPKGLVEVYEKGDKVVLPPWDPMGTLA
ncbi:bleomycin hydrolase [Cyathus striatus]|nr:bleomycin hydrolase [Cyathus striatus]